jgi:hypothetical protein
MTFMAVWAVLNEREFVTLYERSSELISLGFVLIIVIVEAEAD